MYFCFAYDYTGRSSYRPSLSRFKKLKKKDRVIVKLKRPYFEQEQQDYGESIFHSRESVLIVGRHSETFKKRLLSAKAGTFIQLQDHLCLGGPRYGLLAVSDEEYEAYANLLTALESAQKKEKDLFKSLSKNNDFIEYTKSIQDQKNTKKSIASFLDEE